MQFWVWAYFLVSLIQADVEWSFFALLRIESLDIPSRPGLWVFRCWNFPNLIGRLQSWLLKWVKLRFCLNLQKLVFYPLKLIRKPRKLLRWKICWRSLLKQLIYLLLNRPYLLANICLQLRNEIIDCLCSGFAICSQ